MRSTPPDPAPDTIWRSPDSVELATFHPAPTAPTLQASGTRAAFEKHLVEVDLTTQVAQRAHLDTRLVEIDEEVRQPLALGHLEVGARQEHGPVRDVRPRGPHLLTGDDPVIAVALGPGGQGGKVGTGARLAEELAPDLLVADDRREKAKPLLLGPVREQGGSRQVEPEGVQAPEVERSELLLDPPGRLRREIEPAVGARPGGGHEPGSAEDGVPRFVLGPGPDLSHRGRPTPTSRLDPCRGHRRCNPASYGLDDLVDAGVRWQGHEAPRVVVDGTGGRVRLRHRLRRPVAAARRGHSSPPCGRPPGRPNLRSLPTAPRPSVPTRQIVYFIMSSVPRAWIRPFGAPAGAIWPARRQGRTPVGIRSRIRYTYAIAH